MRIPRFGLCFFPSSFLLVTGCLSYEYLQHHPGGNHVADVAKDDEDVEHGVYVGHLLETVEHGAHDVGHALGHDPQHDGESAGVVEGLEGHEDGEPHEHVAGGLEVALCLHLAKAECSSHDGAEPHEEAYCHAPHGCSAIAHGDERQGGVAACDVPVDGSVVQLAGQRLGLRPRGGDGVVDYRGGIGADYTEQVHRQAEGYHPRARAATSHKEVYTHGQCHGEPHAVGAHVDNLFGKGIGVLLFHSWFVIGRCDGKGR